MPSIFQGHVFQKVTWFCVALVGFLHVPLAASEQLACHPQMTSDLTEFCVETWENGIPPNLQSMVITIAFRRST